MDERLKKRKALLDAGVNPYPYSYEVTHSAKQVVDDYDALEGKKVSLAGRLIVTRSFGKLCFAKLRDASGDVQVFAQAGLPNYEVFAKLEAGDIVGVKGVVAKTKRGEKSVHVKEFKVLAKALRQLPEKFHGLTDTETRYRKRYLDLIVNPEVREIFVERSKMISLMRRFFDGRGFIEVETPILQPVYGGAAAKPFKTRHNALDADFYLRIADELYLKRLIIGGLEKVYEFGKDFRNEDIDSMHNPEFTMVEFYEAYKDYEDVMAFTEELMAFLAGELKGSHEFNYQGKKISFKPPFKRVSFVKAIKEESGVDVLLLTDAKAGKIVEEKGLDVSEPTRAHVIDALFDEFVLPDLWDPCFVCDYPAFLCSLTKGKRGNPRLAERFELFIGGQECGNAYSELSDPVEQRKKFKEQAAARAKGDEEAQPMDEDFLEAIEYGMPPTGGMGIGVDRLAMIFTDQTSIKEVVLFPSMRPKQ